MIALRENKVLGERNLPEKESILSLLVVNTDQCHTPVPLQARGCSCKTPSSLWRTQTTIFREAARVPSLPGLKSQQPHIMWEIKLFSHLCLPQMGQIRNCAQCSELDGVFWRQKLQISL